MIPISIDISDFIGKWELSIDQADLLAFNILDEVSNGFAREWEKVAGRELHQSKLEYQRAIYIEKPDPLSVIVGLKGVLPNMIEKGISPFDQKEGFEKSNKKKVKEGGGWYLTVPFRFATPGAVAESSIFSQVLPGAVYKVALQNLKTSKNSLSVKKLPEQFQMKGMRPEMMNQTTGKVFQEYQHKSSIYEGLTKSQGGYTTFRRVSDNSDPNAWIHSGIQAHDLASKALQGLQVDRIIGGVKNTFVETNLI